MNDEYENALVDLIFCARDELWLVQNRPNVAPDPEVEAKAQKLIEVLTDMRKS